MSECFAGPRIVQDSPSSVPPPTSFKDKKTFGTVFEDEGTVSTEIM